MNKQKKQIVISAVNLFSGGPLTVLKECLSFLENDANIQASYKIVAVVHDEKLLPGFTNITFLSFPKPRSSWQHKLYYEYVYFKKISKQYNVHLWFSLHDMTPSVLAERRAVYCHNPAPFYRASAIEKSLDKGFALFTLFYKYLYRINIKKNDYVVVQQDWIRKKFVDMFHLSANKIIVAYPDIKIKKENTITLCQDKPIRFLYPALPRVFKNFEVILQAVPLVREKTPIPFEVILTIDGTENAYSKYLKENFGNSDVVKWMGLQTHEKMNRLYQSCSCVIFPSKLETWGLPITEAKQYCLPVLAANLPYAKETVGDYDKVSFFQPGKASELADKMIRFIEGNLVFTGNTKQQPTGLFSESWEHTFRLLLQ